MRKWLENEPDRAIFGEVQRENENEQGASRGRSSLVLSPNPSVSGRTKKSSSVGHRPKLLSLVNGPAKSALRPRTGSFWPTKNRRSVFGLAADEETIFGLAADEKCLFGVGEADGVIQVIFSI